MANTISTKVRFLGGHAAKKNFFGVLGYPIALDEQDVEYTRFYMVKPDRWVHRPFDADIVSVEYIDGFDGKSWWLLGKRGDVYSISASGLSQDQIIDSGTGAGKFGYLNKIKLINGKLYACGYRRQVYERTTVGWVHQDQGILLNLDAVGHSLNDIVGNKNGVICAVGSNGEIAFRLDDVWSMVESPTNEHLHAVCFNDKGLFCAAGGKGTVILGNKDGFESICSADFQDSLWDIEFYRGEFVVSATAGLFIVRDGGLVPFDKPIAPIHVGYRIEVAEDMLWSIGTYQIFVLNGEEWSEWVCPDNV